MSSDGKQHWTHYFRDTTHRTFGVASFFVRFLPDSQKLSIQREYFAQKTVSQTGLTPKPYFVFLSPLPAIPSFMIEEKINFSPGYRKDKQFLADVGHALKVMHEYSRAQGSALLKHVPVDPFLQNGSYSPLIILENFIELPFLAISKEKPKLVTGAVKDSIARIHRRVRKLAKQVKYKPEYCSLIHGDLNETNIVRRKDASGVTFLDWADSRWDIASCDVAQFVYLHKLTEDETRLFLTAYGEAWIIEPMMQIHRLLLIGWDIIYLLTIDLQIPPDKVDRLLPLKQRVWDEETPPI